MSLTTGGYNTAVGFFSLRSENTDSFNTAIGAGTLVANIADENTATGAGALFGNTPEEARAMFRREAVVWREVIEKAQIRLE